MLYIIVINVIVIFIIKPIINITIIITIIIIINVSDSVQIFDSKIFLGHFTTVFIT